MFTIQPGSFPKKEMEKNQERLIKTIKKIFGKIIINILAPENKKDNPYELTAHDIESNGTMRNKTISILRSAEVLPNSQSKKSSPWSLHDTIYYNFEQLFKEHSEEYAEPIEFPIVPDKIKDFLEDTSLREFSTEREKLYTYGYVNIACLTDSKKIYVYYHQDLYDFTKDKDIYPKAMLESRVKAVLKALMRLYCEEDMLSYLKRKFDIDFSGQEIVRDEIFDAFKIELRNFSRYPITFMEHCFTEANNNYAKEYKKNVAKINFEYERLKKLNDKLITSGGCKVALEEYIKESLSNLVSKAPLLINGTEDDTDALEYLLDHRELITWDYLYN